MQSPTLIDYDNSAALGKTVPVDDVPIGFMVLATCPLILWLLDGTVAGFASALLIIGLFSVGLLCLSVGQRNHLAYARAEVAARPKIPFKLIGSAIVAFVVGVLATAKIGVPAIPLVIGCATFILCLVSFGLDPMRDKGMDDPSVRRRLKSQRIYDEFDDRFERLLMTLDSLQDDDLTERTRKMSNTIMGLIGTVDFEKPTLQKIASPLSKMLSKMEAETEALIETSKNGVTPFQRRKYHTKMQALADTFEARARKNGIAAGMDSFELQADLLFDRMQRDRSK
ncbi:hypothetical protein [Marivita hallyeonensis]|uniref:5-bromo-4-chloroindolyl phosphate hydrolysis protein n=1 Tax=Marivita hallyeonensis TaxID=996342 RepID=A0A1M5MF99_9RHOB|nr:hypothetical protein [Marivita hallyeonensis]SHG75837.1 hypothetical protein SAMN05443551_0495 [Marivita hallyeonensis]